MTNPEIKVLAEMLERPFYQSPDFWINFLLGLIGVGFSIMAYREAKAAKNAAAEAGRTVKIQTITIELSEIAQRLDKLDFNLSFSEARDLLNEVSRKLRRLIAPFQSTPDLEQPATDLKKVLADAKIALEALHPQDGETSELPLNTLYFGMQGHFSNISNLVAEIMGLFEKRTIEVHTK